VKGGIMDLIVCMISLFFCGRGDGERFGRERTRGNEISNPHIPPGQPCILPFILPSFCEELPPKKKSRALAGQRNHKRSLSKQP